ncbi:hypothetical protein CYMTET_30092, partial [Cymbomonas tetramitiformis]
GAADGSTQVDEDERIARELQRQLDLEEEGALPGGPRGSHQWEEFFTNEGRIYYHNASTGDTQWERPEELNSPPINSGGRGRGNARVFDCSMGVQDVQGGDLKHEMLSHIFDFGTRSDCEGDDESGSKGKKGKGGGRGKGILSVPHTPLELARNWSLQVGEWKPMRNARYLQWEGTGLVCIICFRLWAVTTGHLDSDGVCPYSCSKTVAPGRAPPIAPPPPPMSAWPPPAPPAAHALRALEPPPPDEPVPQDAALTSARVPAGMDLLNDDCFLDDMTPGATPPTFLAPNQLEDEDRPAFRSGPAYIPPTANNNTDGATIAGASAFGVPALAP